MNGTEKNYKTDKTKIKKQCFLGAVSCFWGCDFGGLILYLGFWDFDFEIQWKKMEKNKKPDEKVDRLQGANPVSPQGEGPPRGNSREFFFSAFLGFVPDFQKTNVYEPNFAFFLVISILSL